MATGEWKYYRLTGETGAQGPTGSQGAKGDKGDTGATGNGINFISYFYKTTTSQTAPEASTVTSTTIPTLSATNKYLWQKEVISYTNSTNKTTVALIGVYGDKGLKGDTGEQGPQGSQGPKGDDGAAGATGPQGAKGDKGDTGATGNGISSIIYYYKATASQTTPEANTVTSATIPTLSATNKYLWQKEIISYTDATSKTTVALIGVYGDKGATGETGPQGNPGTNAPLLKAQYSVDGTSNWHNDFTSGDKYMKTSNDNGATWSSAMKIVGENGATGPQGPKGDTGATGPQGPQGIQGPAGEDGSDGIGIASIVYTYATSQTQTGTKTTYQPTMPTLSATNKYLWQKETINFTSGSPKVTEAIIGTYGDTGSQGPRGIQGIQGPKGDTGATGAQGPKGDTGATGSQGPKGDTGATGAQGPKGDTGATGSRGPAGADATQYYYHVVYVNDTSTGSGYGTTPNGQLYTGTYIDTASADASTWAVAQTKGIKWNYTKGATGATGAQGPQGIQGVKGDTGDTGAQGPQGIQGPQGNPGTNAPNLKAQYSVNGSSNWHDNYTSGDLYIRTSNNNGSTWSSAIKIVGLDGAQGPQGPRGPQGEQGPQGIQGIQGPQGNPGANAPQVKTQYSVNGSSSWHDTFTSGDKYMKVSTNNGSTWSAAMKIIGDNGSTGPQGPQGPQGSTGPQGPQGPQGPTGATGTTGAQYLVQWNRSTTITAPSSSDSGWRDTPYEADATYKYIWMRAKAVPAGGNPGSIAWSTPTRQAQYEKWITLSTPFQVYNVDRRGSAITFGITLTGNNVIGTFTVTADNCTLSSSSITLDASTTSGTVTGTYTPSRINDVPAQVSISVSDGSFSASCAVNLTDVTEYDRYSEITSLTQFNSWVSTGLAGDYCFITSTVSSTYPAGSMWELFVNASDNTIKPTEITTTANADQVNSALNTILSNGDGSIPANSTAINMWVSRLAANDVFVNTIKGKFAEFDGIRILGNSTFEGNIENESITAKNGVVSSTTWTGTSVGGWVSVDNIKQAAGVTNPQQLYDKMIEVEGFASSYPKLVWITDPNATLYAGYSAQNQTAIGSSESGHIKFYQAPYSSTSDWIIYYAQIPMPSNYIPGMSDIKITCRHTQGGKFYSYCDSAGFSYGTPSATNYLIRTNDASVYSDGYVKSIAVSAQNYYVNQSLYFFFVAKGDIYVPASFKYDIDLEAQTWQSRCYRITSPGLYGMTPAYASSSRIPDYVQYATVNGTAVTKTYRDWSNCTVKKGTVTQSSGSITDITSCSLSYNGTTYTQVPTTVAWNSDNITFNYSNRDPIVLNNNTKVSSFSFTITKTASGALLELATVLPKTASINIGSEQRPFDKIYANEVNVLNTDAVPVGTILPYLGSDLPSGWYLCNGGQLSKTSFPELFAVIGYKYGGSGDNYNLPNLNGMFLEGSDTAGVEHGAGLPNITGAFTVKLNSGGYYMGGSYSGAIGCNTGDTAYGVSSGMTAISSLKDTYTLDASRSNPIYGNSNTVQPHSLTVRYIIKVYNGKISTSDTSLAGQVALNTGNIAKKTERNLLDNPWFTVNQRGATGVLSTSSLLYGNDRWKFCPNAQAGKDFAYLPKNTYVCQPMEDMSWIVGKTITISFMERNGTIHSKTITAVSPYTDYTEGVWRVTTDFRSDSSRVFVWNLADTGMYVKAVKLELGSSSTLAYDTEPDYATELEKCQRYFIKYEGSYMLATGATESVSYLAIPFPTTMRSNPSLLSITFGSDANGWASSGASGSPINVGVSTYYANFIKKHHMMVTINHSNVGSRPNRMFDVTSAFISADL